MLLLTREALLSPIDADKATDLVIRRLSQAIISGVLKPGDQLPVEAELAAQLNVAQMTLRQALSILRDLGYIETVRGRNGGSFVAQAPIPQFRRSKYAMPTLQHIRELIDYQTTIENQAAVFAAERADEKVLEKIRKHLNLCLADSSNTAQHWLADNAFHIAIAEATKSVRLIRATAEIEHESMQIYVLLDVENESEATPHHLEHEALYEAIASGDADRAWEASDKHIGSVGKFMMNNLQRAMSN
ncbi:MAG: hypothetical protein RLZZ571_1122 [Actinomycetota bacterium]|jgi:DNA-binding FadR family transcriptional regulator